MLAEMCGCQIHFLSLHCLLKIFTFRSTLLSLITSTGQALGQNLLWLQGRYLLIDSVYMRERWFTILTLEIYSEHIRLMGAHMYQERQEIPRLTHGSVRDPRVRAKIRGK